MLLEIRRKTYTKKIISHIPIYFFYRDEKFFPYSNNVKLKIFCFRFKENFKKEIEKGVEEAKEDLKKRRNQ